jgi:hypothetical protein
MKHVELKFHFGKRSIYEVERARPALTVRLSPTQSSQIQPNPTTPPPPGKETVNFFGCFMPLLATYESPSYKSPITNY